LSSYMADKVTQSMLLDGVRVGDRMLVVGEHGHILSSTDLGASWAQIDVPTRSALTGVAFADETHGFAVGHDAVILKTADGGQSWERVYFDPDYQTPLLHIWAPSPQRAVAVGAYGFYLETLDGGETWEQRTFQSEPLPLADESEDGEEADDADSDDAEDDWGDEEEFGEDYHLNKIVRAEDGTLYIAGEAGSFYRSDDDGETWFRLDMPYEGSFFGALPLGGDSLLAFGMRGNLFRSDDRGVTFRPIETGVDALLTSGYVTADGTIVIVGMAGVILESSDGQSFTLYRQSDRKGAMAALPADGGATVLVGEAGVNRLSREAYRSGGAQ
ncbi:MAG: YCF48-related protein, partial [Pseudomonadota bacterium]